MNTIKNQTKKGFTIIEVVLVLAIAGLIFLMVFLALPALQRSQRDTTRKNDASRLRAALNDYQASNRGRLNLTGSAGGTNTAPTAGATATATVANFYATNLLANNTSFNDPSSGDFYVVTAMEQNRTAPTEVGQMFFYTRSACGDNGAIIEGSSVVVSARLEGSNAAYCIAG